MPAHIPMHDHFARTFRAATVLAGVFLLLIQLLGPALASPGQSIWMEICSEAGAVWVEVDLEDGTGDPTAPCPKCADCALCAVTGSAPLPDMPQMARVENELHVAITGRDLFDSLSSVWLWPETRGPPCGSEIITERAARASMASIPIFGGAP